MNFVSHLALHDKRGSTAVKFVNALNKLPLKLSLSYQHVLTI